MKDEALFVAVSVRKLREMAAHSCGPNCPIERLAVELHIISNGPKEKTCPTKSRPAKKQ